MINTEFEDGDFVAVECESRVGIACHGRKRSSRGRVEEIEVWFGDVGSTNLPITHYVSATQIVNLGMARIVKPYNLHEKETDDSKAAVSQ